MKTIKMIYFIMMLAVLYIAGFSYIAVASDQAIYHIQQKLLQLGYDPGPIDGLLGQKTKKALVEYQQKEGLNVTGNPDEPTRKSLGVEEVPKPTKKKNTKYTIRKGDSFQVRGVFICPKYCDDCVSGRLTVAAGTTVYHPGWVEYTCR